MTDLRNSFVINIYLKLMEWKAVMIGKLNKEMSDKIIAATSSSNASKMPNSRVMIS